MVNPWKSKQEAHEKLVEMSINDDYTTRNLLYLMHHQKYYKLVRIDLSRQTNTSIEQKNYFTGKLEGGNGAAMFFINKKQQKTILNISLDSLTITE